MVRFLKNLFQNLTTKTQLDRFTATENLINLLYIPVAFLISLSALTRHGVIPFGKSHEWYQLLPASLYLTIANARDLHICAGNFFLGNHCMVSPYMSLGGLMQLASALFIAIGSISLLNACIINIYNTRNKALDVTGSYQYAGSFGLFILGAAANTLPLGLEFEEHDSSRALLTFQNITASVLFFLEGSLMIPGFMSQESLQPRNVLQRIIAFTASITLIFASIINYFHNLSLLRSYRIFIEEEEDVQQPLQEDEDENVERPSILGRIASLFGSKSTNLNETMALERRESDDEYRGKPLLASESSSTASVWEDAVGDCGEFDVEEGKYGSGSRGRRYGHGLKSKKRKGKRRGVSDL